jgi:hypothetical protein
MERQERVIPTIYPVCGHSTALSFVALRQGGMRMNFIWVLFAAPLVGLYGLSA